VKTKALPILLSVLIFPQVCFAQLCARLKDISAGENHTLALADDNSLWACGTGPLGLGDGVEQVPSLQRVHGPNDVGYLNNIINFDAGWEHSLAVDSNGFVWAWGSYDEYYGMLGNGPNEGSSNVPIRVHDVNNDVNGLRNIVAVSAGRSGLHSLAVDSNGYVYAWGYNYCGQCGDGCSVPGVNRQFPILVVDSNLQTQSGYLGDEANIIDVDAGVDHSLALVALADGGYVYEWGNGYSYPQKVPGVGGAGFLSYIVGISTCYHSVAVDSNGFVYEWQYGNPYKVTAGDMNTASGYLENIVEVGAGSGRSMARTSDGHVLVWSVGGSPEYVEDGEMKTQSGLLEGIISIDAGFYDHKLAVCENGYGWAWGTDNSGGKFGVGDTNPRPEPAQMWCAETSSSIYLTKTSEIQGGEPNCVRPFAGDNYLVYDVCYGNPIINPSDPNYYGTVYDVNIIDHLPVEVNFISADSNGVYDGNDRTVTWHLGNLEPNQEGCFTLTVTVNEYARPGGEITNFAEMTSDKYYSYTTDTVPVCNWGTEIIYVDQDANGCNNGTDWDNAYTDLRDAFIGAQNLGAEVTAIWVAAGTYKPTYDINETDYQSKSFELLEDVGLFGHFGGIGTYETSTSQRNFADANNETVLDGQIGQNYYDAVYKVINADSIYYAVVDGFTIKGSCGGAGVHLDNSYVAVVNCKLKDNYNYGIYAINSHPDIHNCTFTNNSTGGIYSITSQPDISYSILDGNNSTDYGLYMELGSSVDVTSSVFKNHNIYGIYGNVGTLVIEDSSFENNNEGLDISNVNTTLSESSIKQSLYYGIWASNSYLTVERSVIHGSQYYNGVYMQGYSILDLISSVIRYSGAHGLSLSLNSRTNIKNCWIHNNGLYDGGSGIYFDHPVENPLVRNNTIYGNNSYGIQVSAALSVDPNIRNCIIYGNDANDLYRESGNLNKVNYCLLQNAHSGTGNIIGDPGFMNPANPNDLHIAGDSQCKDAGDPNGSYGGETDIDGENRVYYGRVDIGADEYYWSNADFSEDGLVNFIDYAVLAAAWRSKSGEGNYKEDCDLKDNNAIDFNDLALFCEDWLWEKAWSDGGWMMAMGGSGGRGTDGSLMLPDATASLKARPERLIAKTQKFYDITPQTTISAIQKLKPQPRHQAKPKLYSELVELPEPELQSQLEPLQPEPQPQPTEVDIQQLENWLDEIWLNGDLKEIMTEEEYLEFRESIEDSPQ